MVSVKLICTKCKGTGRGAAGAQFEGECPKCGGKGEDRIQCPSCLQKGVIRCAPCSGTGRTGWFRRCTYCAGRGEVRCSKCQSGKATVRCTNCRGTGRAQTCTYLLCERCQGKGGSGWDAALKDLPVVPNSFEERYWDDDFSRSTKPFATRRSAELPSLIQRCRDKNASHGWLSIFIGPWRDQVEQCSHSVTIKRVAEDAFVILYSDGRNTIDGGN